MSVYIKGMEMPKEHPLYITLRPDGSVHVWDSYNGEGYGTQAIPILPHGRLIDADAFEAEYWSAQFWGDRDAAKKVHRAPTIIPADPIKEEEE